MLMNRQRRREARGDRAKVIEPRYDWRDVNGQ